MPKTVQEPQSLSSVLGELVLERGYNKAWARLVLEDLWNTAVGRPQCYQTQIGELRHGVLNVIVAHSTLLEELRAFRKAELIASLRSSVLGGTIYDIQFRVGSIP